jgi:putative peptidoglycan lipid II flippase
MTTSGPPVSSKTSLAGKAGSVSAAILISRILGVGREIVMARYFGAGFYTDAFNTAYRIPNLMRDLFAEGALSSAFIPTFVRQMNHQGRESAWRLANNVINTLLILLGAGTLVIYFGARIFVFLLAAGYSSIPGKVDVTVQMTRIMSPFLLWIALASVVMGMLNACGSFFVPALASSAFNVCCILAGVFLSPYMETWGMAPVVSMAIGALAGGLCQFLVQLPSAWRWGYRYRWVVDFHDPALRRLGALMLPAVIGLSATQINITVDNQFAAMYGDGPVSYLIYAFRLMQLPIGLFGIAIATVTTSAVSHHAAQENMVRLRGTVASSLRLAACLTFPATLGLILFRTEIVSLLYENDRFLRADTIATSHVLIYYALSLFSYSAVKVLVPAFYALGDAKTPVRVSILSVAAKIGINLLLVMKMGFYGLALATAAASWLNMSMLAHRLGGIWDNEEWKVYLRILGAAIGSALVAQLGFQAGASVFGTAGRLALAGDLALAIGASVLSVAPLLLVFRVEEARALTKIVNRFFFRRTK